MDFYSEQIKQEALLDFEFLKDVGDPADPEDQVFFLRLADVLQEESEATLAGLKSGRLNLPEAAARLHKLKGSAANAGAIRLPELLKLLEYQVQHAEKPLGEQEIQLLEATLADSLQALRNHANS